MAASGGDPWIFYMSREFTDHCLATVHRVIEGIGAPTPGALKQTNPLICDRRPGRRRTSSADCAPLRSTWRGYSWSTPISRRFDSYRGSGDRRVLVSGGVSSRHSLMGHFQPVPRGEPFSRSSGGRSAVAWRIVSIASSGSRPPRQSWAIPAPVRSVREGRPACDGIRSCRPSGRLDGHEDRAGEVPAMSTSSSLDGPLDPFS